MNKFALVLGWLLMAALARADGSTNPHMVYVSQIPGIHQNSNLAAGGGMDDTPLLQAVLDSAAAAGNVTLIQDGVSLISTLVVNNSNTVIRCRPGCGFYQSDGTNYHMLLVNVGTPSQKALPPPIKNIKILGGTWNCNGAHQTKYENGATVPGTPPNLNWFNLGIWIANATDVTLDGVTIQDAKNYAYVFQYDSGIVLNNCTAKWTIANVINHDGLHFFGDVSNVVCHGFHDRNGGDDGIALNTDEPDGNGAAMSGGHDGRWPATGGTTTHLTFYDTFFDNSQTLRFHGEGTSGAVIDNVRFYRSYGTHCLNGSGMQCDVHSLLALGTIVIDGWSVGDLGKPNNNICLDKANVADLTLSNIEPGITVMATCVRYHGNYAGPSLSYEGNSPPLR